MNENKVEKHRNAIYTQVDKLYFYCGTQNSTPAISSFNSQGRLHQLQRFVTEC